MNQQPSTSARLVDYVAIVGAKSTNNVTDTTGRVLQRFPATDWDDVPFFHGLEMFVSPDGYGARNFPWRPRLHMTVLTDVHGTRHHCAILNIPTRCTSSIDDESDSSSAHSQSFDEQMMATLTHDSAIAHAPLCIVLVGRHAQFHVFKHCLTALCTLYMDATSAFKQRPPSMETMVVDVLTKLYLPEPGLLTDEYTLGIGDRLTVRAPLDSSIPTTGTCVSMLYRQLGTLTNLVTLVTAVLCDKKIIFHSRSYVRLSDACHALVSLMYPLKYTYAYVPIVPVAAMDILMLPTPYIMGVHATLKEGTVDQLQQAESTDVVMVDLDCGTLCVPSECRIEKLPQPYNQRLMTSLLLTVNEGLSVADDAFVPNGTTSNDRKMTPPTTSSHNEMFVKDKRIRACFVRFYAELLTGYRKYLQVIRLHPSPYICLHRAAFLGHRQLQSDAFIRRLFDAQPMQVFVHERGVPYRLVDLFDTLVSEMSTDDVRPMSGELDGDWPTGAQREHHAKCMRIAERLIQNEGAAGAMPRSTIVRPSNEVSNANDAPPFPVLDAAKVTSSIALSLMAIAQATKECAPAALTSVPSADTRLCPQPLLATQNERRVQVLRHCLQCIFDNRVTDARKMMSAVLLSMKTRTVRVEFCGQLHANMNPPTRATLQPPQFDLVVRLMNCALENETVDDEHGVAYALLGLAQTYCRRLTPGMLQFAYTCIQDHPVWANIAFWQSVFYHDVNAQLRKMYMERMNMKETTVKGAESTNGLWTLDAEPSALIVASHTLQSIDSSLTGETLRLDEENILYSQALHYTNMMVCMRTPLDPAKLRHVNVAQLEQRAGGNLHAGQKARRTRAQEESEDEVSVSSAASDTSGEDGTESGYDERVHSRAANIGEFPLPISREGGDLGQQTVRFIAKFLDKISSDVDLANAHVTQLHNRLPAFVAAHIENLEQVYRESRRLPDTMKARLLEPVFTRGERMLMAHVRVHLLSDGRSEPVASSTQATIDKTTGVLATTESLMLPAEGALYITNYRLIFKGTPCDPFACEQVIVRSMPLLAVTKVKRVNSSPLFINAQTMMGGNGGRQAQQQTTLHAALQIRSATFQLMRLAVDSQDVSEDKLDEICELIDEHRYVDTVHELFAFNSNITQHTLTSTAKLPSKAPKSIGGLARQTLLRTAAKAGIKSHTLSGKRDTATLTYSPMPSNDDESVTMKDYQRLHLTDDTYKLRMCYLPNAHHGLVKTYARSFIVPAAIGDDNLRKAVKGYKHHRLPIVTWQSRRNALLIKGASMHFKNVGTRLKKVTQNAIQLGQDIIDGTNAPTSQMKTSVEQERYMNALVAVSPIANAGKENADGNDDTQSVLSIESLMFHAQHAQSSIGGMSTLTDRLSDKRQFPSHLANKLRSSHTKAGTMMSGASTPNQRRFSSGGHARTLSVAPPPGQANQQPSSSALTRARLYMFGERAQSKVVKLAAHCEFVPVVYPTAHQCKAALTKMLRVCAPSQTKAPIVSTGEGHAVEDGQQECTHLRALGESHWTTILAQLLRIAAAIVDIIEQQNSSVAICLEDGWDTTCQLSSLAQIMLDPYYRTIDGLHALVEKEWLMAGHRFSHRHNHTRSSQASGVAPIFLMFLDCVHQLLRQHPGAFEYADSFLSFLAYHSMSGKTKDFLFDCEAERAGALNQDDVSIWEIIRRNRRLFVNDLYAPHLYVQTALRPITTLCALDLWTYYTDDPLAHAAPYDIDCMMGECAEREEYASLGVDIHLIGQPTIRQQLNYDYNLHAQRTGICVLLDELERLEKDLCMSSDGRTMERAYEAAREKETNGAALIKKDDAYERYVTRALHKRFTVDLLLRGKRAMQTQQANSSMLQIDDHSDDKSTTPSVSGTPTPLYAHTMERHHFNAPTYCNACDKILWGVVVHTGLKCARCDYALHEQCAKDRGVPQTCATPEPETPIATARSDGDQTSKSTNRATHTHEGYLQKRDGRGGVLRQWRARYFILDAAKHELRYYESRFDSECRGTIDLGTVHNVTAPVLVKKTESGQSGSNQASFEIRCTHRSYTLMAFTKVEAEEWIDKIHQCLQ